MKHQFDIAVIGAGIAGLTTVQHARLAGQSVVHLMGAEPLGGLVCNIGELRGYPAGMEPISGMDLAIGLLSANVSEQVMEIPDDAVALAQEAGGFRISHSTGDVTAKQVIAATGASLRMLEIPGAQELIGRGISQCAWCDGPLFKDKQVVVVGGGDAAFEEALHLAEFAQKVILLVRSARATARQSYIDRVKEHTSIDVRLRSEVIDVIGPDTVAAVRVVDRASGLIDEIVCSGLFVFIGVQPRSQLLADFVELEECGGVVTDAGMKTRTPGLFAIGAVRHGYGGRLVHAVGEAAIAAMVSAERAK